MTLSDPLLKELKGHIINLLSGPDGRVDYKSRSYGDDDETVFLLCHCLESIFLKGLVRYDGFTPWKADCFQWFYQIVRKYQKVIPLVFKSSFEEVLNDKKTKSHIGKTRLLIRTCLKRKCLHVPLELHVKNRDFHDDKLRVNHRPESSVLGHEILSEIFLSLLLQISNIDFDLDLSNSSFLDESWQAPALVKVEMVPCDSLGLTLGFPLGFPVIVEILDHSAAAELSDRIEIGDILDEINGITLRNLYGSKIGALFKKCRAEPFTVTIVKGRDPKTAQVYLPIIKLYRILGLNPGDTEVNSKTGPIITELSREENIHDSSTHKQEPLLFDLMSGDDIPNGCSESVQQDLLGLDADDFCGNQMSVANCSFREVSDSIEEPEKSRKNSSALLTDDHKDESPPQSCPRKHIPISKFYGEDGDQFIV